MKFVINMATLRGHGSSTVGKGILHGISALDNNHRFFVFIPDSWKNLEKFDDRFLFRRIKKGIINKAYFENITLRRFINKEKMDSIFSCTDTSIPACPVPHLLLLHQPHIVRNRNEGFYRKTKTIFKLKMAIMRMYFKTMLPSISKFTVQTQYMKTCLCKRWGVDFDNVVVVPSAIFIPKSNFPTTPSTAKKWTLGYVASASPHKNHIILPDIIHKLCNRYPNISCALTVTPKDVPEMSDHAHKLGVFKHFDFLGSLPYDQALSLYHDINIFIMPSKLESFGLPYYEAMSQGAALVVADKDFSREACADAALYADCDNASEFANCIDKFINIPALHQEFCNRAFKRYEEVRISWPEIAQEYLSILEELAMH